MCYICSGDSSSDGADTVAGRPRWSRSVAHTGGSGHCAGAEAARQRLRRQTVPQQDIQLRAQSVQRKCRQSGEKPGHHPSQQR